MKPGQPLRRTPLARGTSVLSRGAGLSRGAALQASPETKTGDWSEETRDAVMRRCGGRCELCPGPATDLHHRQARRTRNHRPSNALALCRACHQIVHGHPTESRDNGWIVSVHSDPASTPALIHGRWRVLTAGGYA